MRTALLISTYSWPEALHLVLHSAMIQSVLPSEILIADDGSGKKTKLLIEQFQQKSTVPIQHFWQEDLGFRKAKILNKAIASTTCDYIIQIDGDCIMHKNFVADHINSAQKGFYIYGSRVNILPNKLSNVFAGEKIKFSFFSKDIKNRTRNLSIPFLSKLFKSHEGISKKFRGCNVSFWRNDVLKINGYNEDFEGWGNEDSDLAIRLGNSGILARRLRYAGIVYHLFHQSSSKANLKLNKSIEKETIAKSTTVIINGIQKF